VTSGEPLYADRGVPARSRALPRTCREKRAASDGDARDGCRHRVVRVPNRTLTGFVSPFCSQAILRAWLNLKVLEE